MDYVSTNKAHIAIELKKYQWDYIHNPQTILFAWAEEEEEAAMKGDMVIRSTNPSNQDILDGNRLGIEGNLIVMNNPENKIIVEVVCKEKDAVEIEWSFIDPNDDNALMSEAYDDGIVKLGKKGDVNAEYWYQYQEYTLNKSTTSNSIAITKISNFKSAVQFNPSGVGGDDYIIVANIKDANGKTIKTIKSQALTVVRRIKIENLYHMKGVRILLQYASSTNIQEYFKKAFIIYEAPSISNELDNRFSIKYLAQYDRNNTLTHEYSWKEIAAPIDYNPPIRKANGSVINTEKLTDEEKNNCNSQSVKDKADSWKNRLLRLKKESTDNWVNDIGINKAIISINYYHIMYGSDGDPDMDYNPFLPCTSVPIAIGGFTTYVGTGLWVPSSVGGMNLGNGIVALPVSVAGDDNISNIIAHELGHMTNDVVGGKPTMYRVEFGPGDHSQTSGVGLMEPTPFTYNKKIQFSDKEIKILKGYKQ